MRLNQDAIETQFRERFRTEKNSGFYSRALQTI
jgi:hypothetical protein